MAASSNAVHPPAIAIGGMHRSGTSLTASLVAAAGVHLGDELMAAGAGNPRGHFEDLEFYHLHQRIPGKEGPVEVAQVAGRIELAGVLMQQR